MSFIIVCNNLLTGYLGNNDGMEGRKKSSVTLSFGRTMIILQEGNQTSMQ